MAEALQHAVGFLKSYADREIVNNRDPVRRAFCLVFVSTLALAVLFELCTFFQGPHLCLMMGLLGVGTHMALSELERTESSRQGAIGACRFILFWVGALTVPLFFEGSNVANRVRYASAGDKLLWDSTLLSADSLLLGWLFPHGQLALLLDRSRFCDYALGRLLVEVLQVMYSSYYLWGNFLLAYMGWKYFWKSRGLFQQQNASRLPLGERSLSAGPDKQWTAIQQFICAWTTGYLVNFLLNLLFPAVSPRIYIEDWYHHPLRGVWLSQKLLAFQKNVASNTFSAFPSGHTCFSWMAAVLAYRFGYRRYGLAAGLAAILITMATLVLRYHYAVDVLCAFPMLMFGLWFAGLQSRKK